MSGVERTTRDPVEIAELAGALLSAYDGTPVAPFSERADGLDVATALAVRAATIRHWLGAGRRTIGRKIGLTSPESRHALGATQPIDGFLFADSRVVNGGDIDCTRLIQPRAEIEIGLIVRRDVEVAGASPDAVRGAIEGAVTAIEIVDSRTEGWRIRHADAVADNGLVSGFAIAEDVRALDECAGLTWRMERLGQVHHMSSGIVDIDAILRDFHWLSQTAIAAGNPLRRGELVLSGALGGALPMTRGDRFCARIEGLGECQVSFR